MLKIFSKRDISIILALIIILPMIFVGCSGDPIPEALYSTGGFYSWNGTDWVDVGDHHATHEDGGGDEIDVTGLSGLLADEQDPLDHAEDHEFAGGDQVDISSSMVLDKGLANFGMGEANSWLITLTGGRGSVKVGWFQMEVATGNVANDVTGSVTNVGWDNFYVAPVDAYNARFSVKLAMSSASNIEWYVGAFDNNTTYPTTTSKHIGFRCTNGTIYATNGDGANGTQTAVDTQYAWTQVPYSFIIGTSHVLFFDDYSATPLTTHTTDIPYWNNMNIGAWVKTTDGTVHKLYVSSTKMLISPEEDNLK